MLSDSTDERQLVQTALEHPFEPAAILHASPSPPAPSTSSPTPAQLEPPTPSDDSEDTWQSAYAGKLSEWRAHSASARTKAELTRAKWETIRAHEQAERDARHEPPESSDGLGAHIIVSATAASEAVAHSLTASVTSIGSIEHVEVPREEGREVNSEETQESVIGQQHTKAESGSPSQRWEHVLPSPTSSYPSMSSFPEASLPHSPIPQPALLASASAPVPAETHLRPSAEKNAASIPPSTLPSIMDDRIKPRTRLSLVLSSLAINLFLPFINGVMLGFGEIFAKEVIVGWFGWRTRPGSIAASLGLRR